MHMRVDGPILAIGESSGCDIIALPETQAVALFRQWLHAERARTAREEREREVHERRAELTAINGGGEATPRIAMLRRVA